MSETKQPIEDEETVRRLLQSAGPRPALPEDELASIQEAARREWRRRYGDRAKPGKSVRPWMALAAAVLLAVVGLIWRARIADRTPASGPPVASIELLTGVGRWQAGRKDPVQLPPNSLGRPLPPGSELETGEGSERPGRLAVRMAGGASVRLDAGTRVRLASATLLELERGAVYVDTGVGPRRGEEVAVRVAAGLFQAVGTQFEVLAEGGGAAARLRVREGSVRLERGSDSVLTRAGGELLVRGDGSLVTGRTPLFGPEWDWVLKTAPMLEIEGVKVRTFLDWIGRETGWRVQLADAETAALCDSIVLHGSIAHLTPAEAPSVVLPSSGLGYRLSDGALFVFKTPR
jgi:hypothetical protein